jgi:GT2 family glycosyltransferase
MKLSIIIVTWNTAQITLSCINSINKFLDNPEIIVVDNDSKDNTISLLSKIKNIKLIKNKSNLGFAKANNIGLQKASHEDIIFMNSDIELINNSVNNLLSYFKENNNIGIIGPKFLNPDLTPQASVFQKQNISNAFKEFWLNKKNSYLKYLPNTKNPTKVWAISGGFILTKKSFFQSIGAWNEKYFFYFEDLDLCRKINKTGKDIIFYPNCQVIHRHGASTDKSIDPANQWRRLIPGSIQYHGYLNHYLIFLITLSSQKWQKLRKYYSTKN